MKNRILHLEPGTIEFDSFTPAEYLKEMLGRLMNIRTKGGAKEEHRKKLRFKWLEFVETSCHNTRSEMQMQFKVGTMLNLNIHIYKY